MNIPALHDFFAPCPRGLEEPLIAELAELGIAQGLEAVPGGVHFRAGWPDCYRVNLHSRLASRVLWRVAKGTYGNEEDIYRLASKQDWGQWLDVDGTMRVDVTATRSPLRSIEFTTLRIKDAICDQLREKTGRRPSIDTRRPDARVFAFVDQRVVILYLDTSGDALFKRGWRSDTGDAPLRENLAAGILRLAGWKPGIPLFDPMCGSGTFAVEAAQWSLGIPPGAQRRFGFEKLLNFDAAAWDAIRNATSVATADLSAINISASDVSGDAVVLTRQNLLRGGISEELAHRIAPKQIDARQIRPPEGISMEADGIKGIVVVNPPYGERIGVRGADLPEEFFSEFGNTLKQRFSGWRCCVLTSDMAFQKKLRLAPSKRTPLFNGAIECRLFTFELVAGSNRAKADG